MKKYYGKRVYDGIAIGKMIRLDNSFSITKNIGQGFEEELKRFNDSRFIVINNYKELYNKQIKEIDEDSANIILSFIMIAEDLDLIDIVEEQLRNSNVPAEVAVNNACQILQEMLSNLDNDYLKERTNDINEVCNKIINQLQNKQSVILNEPSIIIAKNMEVSTLFQIEKDMILGLVLEDVSPNAHISILARSLAIPCLVSISEKIEDQTYAILDSSNSLLITNPTLEVANDYTIKLEKTLQEKEELEKYKDIFIKTIDNKTIKVYANISSTLEVKSVIDANADGIGLFRSEYIYINSNNFPSEESQFEQYKKCVSLMNNKPTIIRTMDIGADKSVNYFSLPQEKNPFLGYRGVRLYKEFKEVFLTQIRALLRASYYGNLKIMIPMITNVGEIKFVLECINEAKESLKQNNIPYNDKTQIGVMIETPASALICDELADYVDFFSIGTNDLSQYVLAIDRENEKVLDTFNPKHKAILRLIYNIAKIAKEKNIDVGICGELAREKDLLGFYILCDIDELSVSASYILECKKNILQVDTSKINIYDYIK